MAPPKHIKHATTTMKRRLMKVVDFRYFCILDIYDKVNAERERFEDYLGTALPELESTIDNEMQKKRFAAIEDGVIAAISEAETLCTESLKVAADLFAVWEDMSGLEVREQRPMGKFTPSMGKAEELERAFRSFMIAAQELRRRVQEGL